MPELSLSPAAEAVLSEAMHRMSAGESEEYAKWIAAAAIEALADQVVPESCYQPIFIGKTAEVRWQERQLVRREILAVAAELRGTTTP